MMKKIITLLMAITMASSMCMTAYAGSWEQAGTEWKYADNGTYLTGWQWINGKSYYFDNNGIMAKSTVIDGYELNADGQWIVNGEVQTRTDVGVVQSKENMTENTSVNHSANYDPAHPLAGKIDEWDLRLPTKYIGEYMVTNNNIQAMLTNQMDQYYMPPVGHSVSPLGSSVYTSETAYANKQKVDQDLYNWYCNWLNSISFETMSEMERAKEIQKVLGSCHYDTNGFDNSSPFRYDYAVLINKTGVCEEFAMTACSLAKSLGLKSAVSGSGTHAVYYIQVDGKTYGGQNQAFYVDYVYNDVSFWN